MIEPFSGRCGVPQETAPNRMILALTGPHWPTTGPRCCVPSSSTFSSSVGVRIFSPGRSSSTPRFAVVIPTGAEAAALRVPRRVRDVLRIDVYAVSDDGQVEKLAG